jgi:hypothetical protein
MTRWCQPELVARQSMVISFLFPSPWVIREKVDSEIAHRGFVTASHLAPPLVFALLLGHWFLKLLAKVRDQTNLKLFRASEARSQLPLI